MQGTSSLIALRMALVGKIVLVHEKLYSTAVKVIPFQFQKHH